MTPAALDVLKRIAAAGLDVQPDPDADRLWVPPRERITPELRAAIVGNRDALRELLTRPHWAWRVTIPGRVPFVVWVCGNGATRAWMQAVYPTATALLPLVREAER